MKFMHRFILVAATNQHGTTTTAALAEHTSRLLVLYLDGLGCARRWRTLLHLYGTLTSKQHFSYLWLHIVEILHRFLHF
jgi:hypothetical protein